MNRQIQFRVRNTITSKIIGYEALFPADTKNTRFEWAASVDGVNWANEVFVGQNLVREQFTGVRDWKGIMVYEGDKVMATYKEDGDEVSSPGVVEWYEHEAMFGVRLGDPEGDSELWGFIKFKTLEVY